MHIVLNGDQQDVPPGCTLHDLLTARGWDRRLVAVEINRQIVTGSFAQVELADGDHVEVVHFVGGGAC